MSRWLFGAVVVLVVGIASPVFAQDAHVGTWKQNFDKSKIDPPPTNPRPQSVTRTYEMFGDGLNDVCDSHHVNKRGGKVVSTGRNVVSKDGKTMTFTSKGINANGQPFTAVAVFEKQ